jgi:hypothetical protein
MCFKCQECNSEFDALKSLHAHVKKHNMLLGDYYVKHYRRKNKLTGELIPFKNYSEYFEKDFSNYEQLLKWCEISPPEIVSEYILSLLKNRIDKKELKYGPSTIELYSANLPPVSLYKKHFGSYSAACEKCGVKPMFASSITRSFHNDFSSVKIFIDTREQKPLEFKNSEKLKLDTGDYAVSGDYYKYCYVDRKSIEDLAGTLSSGNARFRKELERCRSAGCFLFIVIEEDLYKLESLTIFKRRQINLKFILHALRDVQQEYGDCCQFVFSGSRKRSEFLIPKLLVLGDVMKNVDVQYYLNVGLLDY